MGSNLIGPSERTVSAIMNGSHALSVSCAVSARVRSPRISEP